MKVVFLVVTTCSLFVSQLQAQDEVIDVDKALGKEKYTFSKLYAVKDGSVLIDLISELVLINSDGVVHSVPNPLAGKKYKDDVDQYINYEVKNDVYCHFIDGNFVFVKNFSTEKPELIEVRVPKLENLRGSIYKYDDKKMDFRYNLNTYSVRPTISIAVEFIDEDNLIVARSYVSMSKNSHGAEVPNKNNYNSFVRLTYINLKSLEVKEEYVLKDVFEIERKKNTQAIIRVLGFKNNEFRIGILELHRKLVHPAARGSSYSGKYRIQSYNIETKQTENIGTIAITPEQNSVHSSVNLIENGIAVSWTEHVKEFDFYSLSNKTYRVMESGEVDSVRYIFPTDIVALQQSQTTGVFNYTNLKGDEFAVLAGDFMKNKRDKDPVKTYVLVDREQNSMIRERIETKARYYDPERKNTYVLDLETDDQELFSRIDRSLIEKGQNPSRLFWNSIIVKTDDKKIMVIKYLWEGASGIYMVSPATFLVQFIEAEL